MDYLAVKDLKKTRDLWQKLDRERELIITRDGKPSALMISVSPETVDDALREIRRALFSAAVGRARKQAETDLRTAQEALIHTEKMAAMGRMSAAIVQVSSTISTVSPDSAIACQRSILESIADIK